MNADIFILVAAGLAVYAALAVFAAEYGRRTGWQVPEGTDANDWALRQRVGWTLGALAIVACAIGCALTISDWLPRAFVVAQAAVMAAAGASDLRRFHLPLPLQMLGIALAVTSLALLNTSPFMLAFALAWAVAIIVAHSVLSRGSMQLGDHIATIWIALAMPFNGLLAVALGDFANVIFAQVKGMRGKKVAAAGSWLIVAAAILALPPYFAWFNRTLSTQGTGSGGAPAAMVQQQSNPALAAVADGANLRAQVALLDIAGDQTAIVALQDTHADRVARATLSAHAVAQIAISAQAAGAETQTVVSLVQLSRALATYDTAGVRASTARLAADRESLNRSLALAQSPVAQTSEKTETSQSSTLSTQPSPSSIAVHDTPQPSHRSSKE